MSKWTRLLDVYSSIEDDPRWDHLRTPGIRLVRGDGPETAETAKIMVVGEAPGAHENGEGKPFVGPSGRILEDLMALAGIKRSDCFITNVVKYRPPGNRTPTLFECLTGQESLREEWSVLRPALTIAVGSTAHTTLRPAAMAVSYCRARLDPFGDAWVTSQFHPAYGLRNPKAQGWMERDWEELGALINEYMPEVLLP